MSTIATSARPDLHQFLYNLVLATGHVSEGFHQQNEEDARSAELTYSDGNAFLQIYESHYSRILSYLNRRTMCQDTAQDLTSRTFLLAFQQLRNRKLKGLRVLPWLYRIATNEHLRNQRSSIRWCHRVPLLGALLPHSNCADMQKIEERSVQAIVRNTMLQLPPMSYTVLLLRYDEALSYAQIAAVLGTRESKARSRVFRALRQLETLLPPEVQS
jgi:RNA polymerase sigma-70 factor (ECF subfamily)